MEIVYVQSELNTIAKKIIEQIKNKTLAFYAPMGAGKTTLIKALVEELGGVDNVSSPTFGLVNEYHKENGEVLAYHFDFYRLKEENEALDMGLEDYLYTENWVFIEWPEKIPNLIPKDAQIVRIETIDPFTRQLTLD